jgi:hypothetical protein
MVVVITNSSLIILKIATARTCCHHYKTICDTLKLAHAYILVLNATNNTEVKGNILTTKETDQLFNF